MNRRQFLGTAGVAGVAAAFGETLLGRESGTSGEGDLFTVSLSQWGFHRAIFGNARDNYGEFINNLNTDPDRVLLGEMDPRDIVVRARELGVGVVDLVNILWFGHGKPGPWLRDFKRLAADEGVGFGVMMCDNLGEIGAAKQADRDESVSRHLEWMETAAELGCPFLRVNPYGSGTYLEQCERCAESVNRLADRSEEFGLEILVENHGHPGSNGAWLAMLIEMADHSRTGVYTDFDNFFMGGWGIEPERRYDRLQGMLDLAPYTKAVSAKSHDFGDDGEETTIDYGACLKVVLDAGFRGLAGAEYEGNRLSEKAGSEKTVALLRKKREALGPLY